MIQTDRYKWQQYKWEFLYANNCTPEAFERDYVAFMATNPTTKDYLKFAKKYHITIHTDPNIPKDLQVMLSVSIAAIKVMAKTYEESLNTVKGIMANIDLKQ